MNATATQDTDRRAEIDDLRHDINAIIRQADRTARRRTRQQRHQDAAELNRIAQQLATVANAVMRLSMKEE